MIKGISIATFVLWAPPTLLGGYLLWGELPPGLRFHSVIQFRSVLLEAVALLAGLTAILFAAVAAARNTKAAAAAVFIATAPGAVWSSFMLWMLLGPWSGRTDPTPIGWLSLIDMLLTIALWPAWFVVWRTTRQTYE